jgi:hypothetical protein
LHTQAAGDDLDIAQQAIAGPGAGIPVPSRAIGLAAFEAIGLVGVLAR